MDNPATIPLRYDEMKLDIEEYINSVELLAKTETDFAFTTSSPEAANIVISKILEHSKKEVKIYDHSLNGDIAHKHPIFFSTLEKFFEDGKILKIVLRSHDENYDSYLFNFLAESSQKYPTQVNLRLADEEFKANIIDVVHKDVNFTVSDANSFRVENVESAFNEHKEAICNFNDNKLSIKLNNLFDKQFEHCETKMILPEYA